jgi:hypothetical protein
MLLLHISSNFVQKNKINDLEISVHELSERTNTLLQQNEQFFYLFRTK